MMARNYDIAEQRQVPRERNNLAVPTFSIGRRIDEPTPSHGVASLRGLSTTLSSPQFVRHPV